MCVGHNARMGDLVFIGDVSQLEGKILWAAERYQRRYGHAANLVMLHPSLMVGRQQLGGLQVEARKTVLPGYAWIGVDTAKAPLAR